MKKYICFICPKCKIENNADEKRSSKFWKVVSATCDKCGERLVLDIKNDRKQIS